jgi:DeoR family transcriptional regulator of aga operon
LETEGILERTHGGAILSQRIRSEPEYTQRAQRHPDEKRNIGGLAADLIEEGDIVFINSGTTTTQIILQIRKDLDVTIVTNNLQAVLEMGDVKFEVILLGGLFQPRSNSTAGRFAVENLGQIYATKAFISVDGFSQKNGCTVPSNAEAEVIQLMIERTRGPISIVADHSKWGAVSNYEIGTLDQFHRLITDEGLDEYARTALLGRPLELLIASRDLIKT